MNPKGEPMVYLTVLLTILISILIYTFDPAPNRSEHDIRAAEAYVLDFVNQHQAARDFMQHWMGHSKANTGAGVIISGDHAMRMESFIHPELKSNMHLNPNLKFNNANGNFKSAYLCLDDDLKLRKADTSSACKSRYVVTYSNLNDRLSGRPSWWADRESDSISKGRWRRAIAQRTRGSYGCGVLVPPPENRNFWCYKTGVKNSLMGADESSDSCPTSAYRKGKYCIDNGEGCQGLLPQGIETFLKEELDDPDIDLSDMLICISSVKNPYVTDGLVFQYDGIDTAGNGAPSADTSSVPRDPTKWSKCDKGWVCDASLTWSGGEESWDNNAPALKMSVGKVLKSGLKLGETHDSFTLTVVAKISSIGNTQTIIGPIVSWNGNNPQLTSGSEQTAIALTHVGTCPNNDQNISNDCFLFSTQDGTTGLTAIHYTMDNPPPNSLNGLPVDEQVMSWTMVKRPKRENGAWDNSESYVYLYNGPAPVCLGSNVVKAKYEVASGIALKDMKLGGDNEIKVYAVRYYDRPLTRREIYHNFLVDAKRYGVSRWDTNIDKYPNESEAFYKNEGGACEKFCEVDSDCLGTYEICGKDNVCGKKCQSNNECSEVEKCQNGVCIEK